MRRNSAKPRGILKRSRPGWYGWRTSNTRIILDNAVGTGICAGQKGNDGADVDQNGVAEECDDVKADNEEITTGSGDDRIDVNTAAANGVGLANSFYGGENNDTMLGGAGDDYLFGDTGADIEGPGAPPNAPGAPQRFGPTNTLGMVRGH